VYGRTAPNIMPSGSLVGGVIRHVRIGKSRDGYTGRCWNSLRHIGCRFLCRHQTSQVNRLMHPIRDLKTPNLLRPFEVVIWGENKDRPLYRCQITAYSDDEARTEAQNKFHNPATLLPSGAWPKITRIDVCDGIRFTPHQRQRGLFEDIAEVCLGSSMDDVQGAAVNLLLTAVQRRAKALPDAEARWTELMHRGLAALQRRYSGQTDARDAETESDIAKRLIA
jgi:hypothetical protein